MIQELILKNRSYRRFHEQEQVGDDVLRELINLARMSPSAANKQSLKYITATEPGMRDIIFETLAWAGYLKDWDGPEKGERPAAYILMLNDTQISTNYFCDHGIAAQSILLGAVEHGLGGCIIASVNKNKLRENLKIPSHLEIIQVIALGKPKEQVKLEVIGKDGDIKYWRDEQQVHHVPKRALDDVIIHIK